MSPRVQEMAAPPFLSASTLIRVFNCFTDYSSLTSLLPSTDITQILIVHSSRGHAPLPVAVTGVEGSAEVGQKGRWGGLRVPTGARVGV